MNFPIEDQIETVRREAKRRHKIFPHLIEKGALSKNDADLEIGKMESVLRTLTQLKGIVK